MEQTVFIRPYSDRMNLEGNTLSNDSVTQKKKFPKESDGQKILLIFISYFNDVYFSHVFSAG